MATTAAAAGLTQQEAERKLAARPPAATQSSRSYKSIVVANVFTVFNLILLAAGVLTLAFGDVQDAIFLAILVANAGIGIAQEVRAKQTLDRLAALVAPTANVLRDDKPRRVAVDEVVEGDIVLLDAGDQVVADGTLRRSDGLAVDESILTGESEPVSKIAGEEVQSGSFAVEGAGAYLVTAVGEQSHAARVTGQAREFRHPRSPLERAINRLLFILVGVLDTARRRARLGALPPSYLDSQRGADDGRRCRDARARRLDPPDERDLRRRGVRMARRGALTQQLNAIESLASVDAICLDKTGTLTDARLQVELLVPAAGVEEGELAHELGRYAASARSRNATLEAIGEHCGGAEEEPRSSVPFSSRRRWSSLQLGSTTFVLGAPELFPPNELQAVAEHEARAGRRVVAFGTARGQVDAGSTPVIDEPLGLVVLGERLRADARETIEFLQSQGVRVFVISGDRPETVAAVAADVGIEGPALDGRDLPRDPAALRRLLAQNSVIGRISPEEKKRVVETLAAGGLYVAMVGDGVNDVPALKAARLAIAQGNGSQMARAVADLVLVRGDFASVPALVAEGRKVLRNLQRVAKLFVAKSAFAFFLVISIGLTPQAYPLLPRHLTLAAALTIGIPAFFLALGPSEGRFRTERFLFDVGRFAVPAGTAAGLGVLASFVFARNVGRLPLVEARTIATTVLVLVGLYLILALEATSRRRGAAIGALTGAMLVLYALVIAAPGTRHFFALTIPGPGGVFLALAGATIAVTGLWLTDDRFVPGALRA